MTTRRTLHGALVLLLSLCSTGAGAAQAPPPRKAQRLRPEPPRIDVPGPWNYKDRKPLLVDPSALPDGARGQFPAYDGDPFFIILPVKQRGSMSADDVAQEVLVPVLKALRYRRGLEGLGKAPKDGVKQPVANFHSLAQVVADEYARTPKLHRPRTKQMLDVFLGRRPPTPEIDQTIETGEGMTFAQFVANVERLAIVYPFQQMVGNVPIEHTLVHASRWEGQGITTVQGALFDRYLVGNSVVLSPTQAVQAAIVELNKIKGVKVGEGPPVEGPVLVLLPYQSDPITGVADLRYAYRMQIGVNWSNQQGPFLLWLDAATGRLLKLLSFIDSGVAASGTVWNRDPGIGTTSAPWSFQVDPSAAGLYTLELNGFTNRIDYQGDGVVGFNALDTSISDSLNGSSAFLANFNQAPINDAAQALCASGTNKSFQQVHFMGTLSRHYQTVLGQGIFLPFPTSDFSPRIESTTAGCNAFGGLNFGACAGYTSASCPNASDNTNSSTNFMNTAHDNTWIAHELGHSITPRLSSGRPSDWCGAPPCSIPVGWGNFHDLCDAWSAHFESTNCWSGWFGKNLMGVDASLNCLLHDEGGFAPRLHQVTTPFNPGAPGDHFPEHRAGGNTCGYCDMQIASAALWEVRVGMRSKCRPSGMPQYGVRFQRALKETGFLGFAPNTSDRGTFQSLHDLATKMVDQWATSGSPSGPPAFAHNGAHTTSKVTSGFARTGVFLMPYQCLDGDAATSDPLACPTGENGGDAVVDIDDNEPADDLSINGVAHPEYDFLQAGGPAPTFQVWTGPRYRLDGASGASTATNPSPCNTKFRLEVSNDPAFPASTILSAWVNVDVDPTTAGSPECFGTWTPSAGEWATLQAGGSRVYFRARTRDAADMNERLSTQPGAGLWTVPPPYAVITADGRSDY
jgi:hypothetical protein